MNFERIAEMLCGLRILPFFPSDEHALLALVGMVGQMATSEDQVRWLVNRMTSGIYAQWPGPQEMRACFCSRYRPKDGINAYSTVYLDGIPSERATALQIAAPPAPQIEAGGGGAKPEDEMRGAVLAMKSRRRAVLGPATPGEIAAAPDWLKKIDGYDL